MKNTADMENTADKINKQYAKLIKLQGKTIKILDECPVRMGGAQFIGTKYKELEINYARLLQSFSDLNNAMKFNEPGE